MFGNQISEENSNIAYNCSADLNDSLYALGFSVRYFIFLAIESTSFTSLICNNASGEGAKSRILGAPTTTGTEPTNHDQCSKLLQAEFQANFRDMQETV